MRFVTVAKSVMAIGIMLLTADCTGPRYGGNSGPGCLIQIYSQPAERGYVLPVVQDPPELAAPWHDAAASAKVIYGTWRLFAESDYKGFIGDYKAPADVSLKMPALKLGSLRCTAPEPPRLPPGY